jgi:hypothetical protein
LASPIIIIALPSEEARLSLSGLSASPYGVLPGRDSSI